jgi:hypothetical protein
VVGRITSMNNSNSISISTLCYWLSSREDCVNENFQLYFQFHSVLVAVESRGIGLWKIPIIFPIPVCASAVLSGGLCKWKIEIIFPIPLCVCSCPVARIMSMKNSNYISNSTLC